MSEKAPAFQFYPDSWLSSRDILLFSPAEEGAYIRLLAHSWLSPDCGLADDDEELAVLSRLGRAWKRSGPKLRAKFELRGGRLYNERLLQERNKQQSYHAERSSAGKKGMERRWHSYNGVITEPITKHKSSSPSSSPITTPPTPSSGIAPDVGANPAHEWKGMEGKRTPPTPSSGFDAIPGWEWFQGQYPGQVIPDRDCQVYLSVMKTAEDEAALRESLPTWADSRQFRDGFAPAAKRFLEERWWRTKPKDSAPEPAPLNLYRPPTVGGAA